VREREPRPALIINGDDFGHSLAANRAIIDAHRHGVLTSASLMVNEEAAADAILRAHEHPSLAVGLHLSLVLGKAGLSAEEIPGIVDSQGEFSRSPLLAGLKYFFSPQARREVTREMRTQFERFQATGLPFSHVDGHNHLHMHPVVFSELIQLCAEFGVRRLRIVGGDAHAHFAITGRTGPDEYLISLVFNWLSRYCHRQLRGRDFVVPRAVYGLFHSGRIDEEYMLKLLPKICATESTEIYLHPLSPDASDAERADNPGGATELAALLSPRLRSQIEALGFTLATYGTI
jgi:chitin disaccharide deacetylase